MDLPAVQGHEQGRHQVSYSAPVQYGAPEGAAPFFQTVTAKPVRGGPDWSATLAHMMEAESSSESAPLLNGAR